MRKLQAVAVFGVLGLTLACGGGSGGSGGGGGGGGIAGCTNGTSPSPGGNSIAASAPNVATITIDGGLPITSYVNGVFTTVTVCVPNTATCQNIDHVLVDTGSYGLRLLQGPTSSTAGGELTLSLPQQSDGLGHSMAECAQFSDGITWGPVKMADIYVGGPTPKSGESAFDVPVQIIGDPGFSTVPSGCTKFGTPEDTLSKLLANGIIGVGPFAQDCGGGCTLPAGDANNPGLYYACPSGGCTTASTPTSEAVAAQVQNPVAVFNALSGSTVADNNGVIMELPGVPAGGAAVVTGSLVFGIGTQSNNGLGKATTYTADPSMANITTTFAGTPYAHSFIDSGSNGYFFPSSIQTCTSNVGFYCPTSDLTCSASDTGANGNKATINFNVVSADTLSAANSAFNNLAGPNTPPPGSGTTAGFDWGLPFFFGRNVYTGIEQVDQQGIVTQPPFFAF